VTSAGTVMQRCEALGRVSEEPGRLTRTFASEAMREANELVEGWMRAAGMEVRRDAIGNLIARYEGRDTETFVLGSHLDTVRDAGKYDGPLGVLVALACVERLRARGERLPFAVEVVAFADEEGLRYGTTYLGSSVYAGAFDPVLLDRADAGGVTMAEAVRSSGGDPSVLAGSGRANEDLLGYCEVHIEQGPVLEERDLPVGVVAAITGQSRVNLDFLGEAGHAGTVPMQARRDALCAAAQFVLAAEELARREPGTVATVGEISAQPGASNVIPGEVSLSLDVRHQDDATRSRVVGDLRERAARTARSRGLEHRWRVLHESRAVPTAPELGALLARAIEEVGPSPLRLQSGAGHDAAQLAALAPVAMLFVRCLGGVSHNPAESVTVEDVGVAIEVMDRFLKLLAETSRRPGTS
jgi:allantoate deiminase